MTDSGPLAGQDVAYAPYHAELDSPGDRRRFVWYAKHRGIPFRTVSPADANADVVYVTSLADIAGWATYSGPAKIVFELVDSYLADGLDGSRNLLRGVARWATGATSRPLLDFREGLRALCRRADAVVCATEEQRQTLLRLCPNVHVVLDAYDEYGESRKSKYEATSDELRLVWEGLPDNLTGFRVIRDALAELHRVRPLTIDVVTSPRSARWMGRFGWRRTEDLLEEIPVPTTLHPWSPQRVSDIATAADLAVIPLLPEPFALGKPENKLLIFWRMGLPVLASATPAYVRAMQAAGVPDMACRDAEEWEAALQRYGADVAARADAGRAGRRFVETHHTESALLARWDEVFRSLAGTDGSPR